MIPDRVRDDLRTLTQIPGLAGHEQRVAREMTTRLEPYVDEIRSDVLGNVIATLHGSDDAAPSVMLFAHMDSLGFVVRRIRDDGYVQVHRLGGIPEKVLPAVPVTFMTEQGDVPGVIATKAHHVTPPEEKYVVTKLQELFLDVGTESGEETRALGIDIGTPVTYQGRFQPLHGERISATFIDNRGGCTALLETARRLHAERPSATVHFVGSVQEEFNLRGAMPVAHALEPDLAICLDLALTGDTPDLAEQSEVTMGGGATMNLYSFHGRGTLNGLLPHPALVRAVTGVARDAGMRLQRNAFMGGLTDASYVQLVGIGIATIDLGFPMRYSHTPVETCDLSDLVALVDLLAALLPSFRPGFDMRR